MNSSADIVADIEHAAPAAFVFCNHIKIHNGICMCAASFVLALITVAALRQSPGSAFCRQVSLPCCICPPVQAQSH